MQIIKPDSYDAPKPPAPTNSNNNNNNATGNNVPNNPYKATNMFVYGAGKMGALVAAELAVNGFHVSVFDEVTHKIETLMARIYDRLQHAMNQSKLLESPHDIDAILSRVRVASSLQEARDADFVFECCVDYDGVKQKVFRKLDEICPKNTILASNTLNIPLSAIVPHCKRFPGRVIGTRFLFPVLFIPRVELSFYQDPYSFGIKKMASFLKSIQKQPFFFSGKGERELLSHDQVISIYEQQANTFKKLGYPGKVTIPQVFNTPEPGAPSTSNSNSNSNSNSISASASVSVSASNSNSNSNSNSIRTSPVTSTLSNSNTVPSSSITPSSSLASANSNATTTSASSTSSVAPLPASDSTVALDDSKKCVVCMEADRNSVLIPCGHICACFSCGDAITKSATPICPICRVDIKSLVMTFVA